MHKATQIYLLIYQLIWEDKQHNKFWAQFGEPMLLVPLLCIADLFLLLGLHSLLCRKALSLMKSELVSLVLKAGEDWEKYKLKMEDFLVDWEKHNTALLR